MKKPQFENNYIYHIYNRGVEKRSIFTKEIDYVRFINDLYEFNNKAPALPPNIRFTSRKPRNADIQSVSRCLEVQPQNIKRRERITDILAFALMPNHFHLLLQQKTDNGIIRFMQKLGTGYTMYFNQKYQRVGHLFQGRFKAVLVEKEAHLLHLPIYIHLNPLDTTMPSWRQNRILNAQKVIKFLESYRWSSHLDYSGGENFPSVISQKFLTSYFKDSGGYKNYLLKWLRDRDLNELAPIAIEDPKSNS